MFGIIVVPWDVVKIEKCEKPIPIFRLLFCSEDPNSVEQSSDATLARNRSAERLGFSKVNFLKPKSINRRDDVPEQCAKPGGNESQLLIEWVLQ